MDLDINERSKSDNKWTLILILAGVSTLLGSSLPVGYNIGVINTPALIIKNFCNESFVSRYDYALTGSSMNILWSSIVSIFIIGGMTGSCLGALIADNIGRKGGIFIVNLLSLTGSVFFYFSLSCNSVEMLLIGRLLVGLSGGLTTSIVPMYLIEIAPLSLRGSMGVLCPLGVTVGVLVGQVMGLDFLLGGAHQWHYLLSIFGILPALFTPTVLLLPESPKFLLVIRKNRENAIRALCKIRSKLRSELSEDIAELNAEVDNTGDSDKNKWGIWDVIKKRELRLAILLVCSMQAGQQTSGINAVFYYSYSILEKAGFGHQVAQLTTIGAGVINNVMAIVAIPLMNRCNRRTLFTFSTATSTIFLLILCGAILNLKASDWMPKLCIAAIFLYVLFYGLGLGPIPYFIGSELFEVGPRPVAMSLGSLGNWGGNFLVGMTFETLNDAIGAYSFLLFALSTGLLCAFTYFYLPETKGKSPAEAALLCKKGARN